MDDRIHLLPLRPHDVSALAGGGPFKKGSEIWNGRCGEESAVRLGCEALWVGGLRQSALR